MEYVIHVGETKYFERRSRMWTTHEYASKYRSRTSADTEAAKWVGAKVSPYWGAAIPAGTKSFVSPKQSPINRTSAYRSI